MLKNGEYAAWYRTSLGQGTGKVSLRDGQISGQDAFISYGGTYEVDGSSFTATLTTRRHTAGRATVFGVDEVEIKLTGTTSGNFSSCSGEFAGVPGMIFEVTLIPAREEGPLPVRKRNPDAFHPVRLLKNGAR